jgi:MFS family permease
MLGLGISSFQVSQGAIWPDYFGSANIGRIRGLSLPIGLAFSALGAPATGMFKDHTGTYVPAWIAGMVGLAIATLILLATPKPARPARALAGDAATATAPGS